MVSPTHDPDAEPAEAAWLKRLRLILQLSAPGLIVLLKAAHEAAARELVALLQSEPDASGDVPPLRILFEPRALLGVPVESRVILVKPGAQSAWLNTHRPIVRQRRLTLFLWCAPGCLIDLQRKAPDFTDWISHRIEIPQKVPDFVSHVLAQHDHAGTTIAMGNVTALPEAWKILSVREASYAELREACKQSPVCVNGVTDALHLLTALIAHTEANAGHGLLLADPRVVGQWQPYMDAAPVDWEEAARKLAEEGVSQPEIAAATRDLAPGSIGVVRDAPDPIRNNPRWQQMLVLAKDRITLEAVRLATALELVAIADLWSTEHGLHLTAQDLLSLSQRARMWGDNSHAIWLLHRAMLSIPETGKEQIQALLRSDLAEIFFNDGETQHALFILRTEVLPVYEKLEDDVAIAETTKQINRILCIQRQIDEALRRPEEDIIPSLMLIGDDIPRVDAVRRTANALEEHGDLDEALRLRRDHILPMLEATGDTLSVALTWGQIAEIHSRSGRVDQMLQIRRDRELPVYKSMGYVRLYTNTRGHIADALQMMGDSDKALRICREEMMPVYQRLGDQRSHAVTMGYIAKIRTSKGEIEKSLRLYEKMLEIFERLGDQRSHAVTMGYTAQILSSKGEYDDALRLYEKILEIFERLGDQRSRAVTMGYTARILVSKTKYKEALELYEKMLEIFKRLSDQRSYSVTLGDIAQIRLLKGEDEEALRIYKERLEILERLDDQRSRAVTLGNVARVLLARDEVQRAELFLEERLRVYRKLGDLDGMTYALFDLGWIYMTRRDFQRARQVLTESWSNLMRDGRTDGIGSVGGLLGQVLIVTGDVTDGLYTFAKARAAWMTLHEVEQMNRTEQLARDGIALLLQDRVSVSEDLEEAATRLEREGFDEQAAWLRSLPSGV
ncbi:MAG: tetratricopeptide repeat protein [Myxococcota bacterium]